MSDGKFSLFPFQEEASERLRQAALGWVAHGVEHDAPRYGTSAIPFIGQLKAVTGSGKTPILADVVAGLGDAVVIWTSKSAVVVEQTFNNLRGKYRGLLPRENVRILRQSPSQPEWDDLVNSPRGLTIWVLTTASWNEAESARRGGADDARLNLHRPQADWAGGDASPWEQLKRLARPLWIVSDESHNQTTTQLDLLAALRPRGFFMASATPVQNELFDDWQRVLEREPEWNTLAAAGQVPVRTRDVVAAELLKTTLELVDFKSGDEESLDGALAALTRAETAAANEGASISPRCIYVVEQSNTRRGSLDEARPVVIWRYLRQRGVPADEIAVFTDTRDLPEEAERIPSLTRLQPRHRHIIFNQTLQEGWDDPEAYVCYFDGTTRSFIRIRQIVGRVLRQPGAQRYLAEELNTATLIVNTPTDSFNKVLGELKAELRLYAPEDEPNAPSPIRLKTRKDPLPPVPLKAEWIDRLKLPLMSLHAPDMDEPTRNLRLQGKRPWPVEALNHPGQGLRSVISLASESIERTEALAVLRSARTNNGLFLRRRLALRNRNALNAIDPDHYMTGPAYEQFSCQGSLAQSDLIRLAEDVACFYEDRVTYDQDPDPDVATWIAGEHRPRTGSLKVFNNAAHDSYSSGNLNRDEVAFAEALDADGRGVWLRNAESAELGFYIPLPFKVGDSLRFFPDFLWWPTGADGPCWALDTTGRHLVYEKVRGKLLGLSQPRLALVVRGKVDLGREAVDGRSGWSLVIARTEGRPTVEYRRTLDELLGVLVPRTPSVPGE